MIAAVMSRFTNFRKNVRENHSEAGEDVPEPTEEEIAKEEEDSRKHEYRLVLVLEKVREMYRRKGFVGGVEISRSFLCTCNSISCDIDGTEENEEGTVDESSYSEGEKVPMLTKITIRNVTRLLTRLEARARHYRNKPYKENLTISGSITINDPIGLSSISISCEATITSLLAGK